MAFQAMVNGADCGPSNPLQSLLKHIERDAQSSQLDHFSQLEASSSAALSSKESHIKSKETQEFLNPNHQSRHPLHHHHAHHENLFNQLSSSNGLVNHDPQFLISHRDYHQEFLPHHFNSTTNSLSPEEITRMERSFQQQNLNETRSTDQQASWTEEFSTNTEAHHPDQIADRSTSHNRTQNYGMNSAQFMNSRFNQYSHLGGGMSDLMMGSSSMIFNSGLPIHQAQVHQSQPEESKLIELTDEKWEAEFDKAEVTKPESVTLTSSKPICLNKENTISKTQEMLEKFGEMISTREEEEERSKEARSQEIEDEIEDDVAFMKSLEDTWKNLNFNTSINEPELHGWEEEFGRLNADSHDHHSSSILNSESISEFLKDPKPYPFQTELETNKYKDLKDPLEEGKRLVSIGAPLSEAALAFEAACQLNPNRAEAWRMLGETHAADEKEHLAIKAFEKAIGCGGIDGEASWMALAIAWVNEGYELRALATLERWLEDTYPNVVNRFNAQKSNRRDHNPWDRHSRVVDMFLEAARAGPSVREGEGKESVRNQPVDAEIQVGLGVLFYSNNDFLRAKDCFESALDVKPNDYLLWNRLGATLANGGQPEDAIEAYRKALEIRPTFTRAIYNLGVSCMNINCFKEGAEHLLAAISLHQRDLMGKGKEIELGMGMGKEVHEVLPDGDGSQNLYRTLQRAFICLDRQDLADRVRMGVDVEIFKSEGFEF